jgi:hypothetical protein
MRNPEFGRIEDVCYILKYHTDIYLQALNKTTKSFNHEGRYGSDSVPVERGYNYDVPRSKYSKDPEPL